MKRTTLMLILLLSSLILACQKEEDSKQNVVIPEIIEENNKEIIPVDSLTIFMEISPNTAIGGQIKQLDIFLYTDELCSYQRITKSTTLEFELSAPNYKEYTLVVIANALGSFNLSAINHYDSWSNFEIPLEIDNPKYPIMGGITSIKKEKDTNSIDVKVEISPLLCEIKLRSISNLLPGDELIENPRIYLKNSCTKSKLFYEGNAPNIESKTSDIIFLNSDIGVYTQYPNISLYCYPNEVPISETTPPTALVVEFEYKGRTIEKEYSIYPLYRNTSTIFDIDIK